MSTAINHPVLDRFKTSFVIFDNHMSTALSVRVPGCQRTTTDGLTQSDVGCFIAVPRWLRSSNVIDFGTSRKHVLDFLLVINSNLSAILPYFTDIRAFVRRKPLFPYPTPIPAKISFCSHWNTLRRAKTPR